jgi:hypothetical protein
LSIDNDILGVFIQFFFLNIYYLKRWTINYLELEDYDIYIPLAVLMGIIHMMIIGLSKLTDDAYYKFN